MRATPPPRGVALKKAIFFLRSLTDFAYISVIRFVSWPELSKYCPIVANPARPSRSALTSL